MVVVDLRGMMVWRGGGGSGVRGVMVLVSRVMEAVW